MGSKRRVSLREITVGRCVEAHYRAPVGARITHEVTLVDA